MTISNENSKTRFSLTDVAKGLGISPQNLHKTYVKKGKITVCRDELNKPYIELVEVLRVFGGKFKAPSNTPEVDSVPDKPVSKPVEEVASSISILLEKNAEIVGRNAILEMQLKDQKDQLEQARIREERLFSQVDKLTDTIQRLEAPKTPPEGEKKTGFFSRLFS